MSAKRLAVALFVCLVLIALLAAASSGGSAPAPVRARLPVVANQRVLPSSTPTATRTATRTATPTRTPTRTSTPTVTPTPVGDCSTAPILLSPANGAQLDTLIPLFQGDSGNNPNATKLRVEICRNSECSRLAGVLTSGLRMQGVWEWRPSFNLDPATTFYWRARLQCGEVNGVWSPTRSFTSGSGGVILPGPQLIAPADNSTLPGTSVTMDWAAVSGSVEYKAQYQDGDMTVYRVLTETQTTFTGLQPSTTYPWWVQARNDYAWGTESAHWHFTTGAVADANAAIISGDVWFLQRSIEIVEK